MQTENELRFEMKYAKRGVSVEWRMCIVFKMAENSIADESTCSKKQKGKQVKKDIR